MKRLSVLLLLSIGLKMFSQPIIIEIEIDSVNYYRPFGVFPPVSDKDKYVFGTVSLKNNSKKTIVLPHTFDLFPHIEDTLGNSIKWEITTVSVHGAFTFSFKRSLFNRRPRLRSGESVETVFVEVRLLEFEMELGEEYYFNYYLPTIHYKEFRKQFGNEFFMSNAVRFRY
ncbi:MAG: hypothetical protein PHH30_09185 [Bacteroidales bacterium]|nr:hypothetical protein [Bacteroidales bacterium]HOZ29319.1 hypothetical protein [Bacteroidales bacterium]